MLKCAAMNARRVNILAGCTAVVLAFFSLGLHECAVDADEAQIRLVCRHICALGAATPKLTESQLGSRWDSVIQSYDDSCDTMSDESESLLQCVEALRSEVISVRDYRCLKETTSLGALVDCVSL